MSCGREQVKRTSVENKTQKKKKNKSFDFRAIGKEERDTLDLSHPAPASTDSCLLSDFHLKPTPVMGNNTRLHSPSRIKRQKSVSAATVGLIDSFPFCSLVSAIIITDPSDTWFIKGGRGVGEGAQVN